MNLFAPPDVMLFAPGVPDPDAENAPVPPDSSDAFETGAAALITPVIRCIWSSWRDPSVLAFAVARPYQACKRGA